jgi:hypothetical protein
VVTWINYAFVIIFFVEIMLKVILHQRDYFESSWNWFEVFLLVFSVVGMIWNEVGESSLTPLREVKILLRLI